MECVYAADDDKNKCPASVEKNGGCDSDRSKGHICACAAPTSAATTTIATTTAAAATTKAVVAGACVRACVRACALVGYTQGVRVRT